MRRRTFPGGKWLWLALPLEMSLAAACSNQATPADEGETGGRGSGAQSGSGGRSGGGGQGLAGDSGSSGSSSGGRAGAGGRTGAGGRAGAGGRTGGAGGSIEVPSDGEVRAFPGAEGFAARISGGRGGKVIKVTSLAASGPGTLAAALGQSGPRIIVFQVSGVIEADLIEIPYGDVTIAGQTAPGAGITLKGRLWAEYDASVENIIIRHLRIRPSYEGSAGDQFDTLRFSKNRRVMIDHVSASFGVDETVDLYSAQDVTVQWSVIESSTTEGHPEGEHNYGLINGPDGKRVSILKTVFAHNKNRNPALATGPAEVVSNLVYNCRHGFVHHNPAAGSFHFVGNVFKAGPSSELLPFFFDDENGGSDPNLRYYFSDNRVIGKRTACEEGVIDNPWAQCETYSYVNESHRSETPFDFESESDLYRAPLPLSSSSAWDEVLQRAGAYPHDVVSKRTILEAQTGQGSWGAREPNDLMVGLSPTAPPKDSDDDGMPDAWEEEHGLNPEEDDSRVVLDSGYTAIEEYINELAARLEP
jgi:pectate lyase